MYASILGAIKHLETRAVWRDIGAFEYRSHYYILIYSVSRRTHTGRRPYKCEEPLCDKTFTRRTTLNRHMRVHMPGFDPHR
jgi:hypothetical protein